MEPLKERIAIKALHPKPQEVDRELLARVEALGASLRPTPVVRLVHPRLNLFVKLEYNNVVGSLKADREALREHRLHSDQVPKPAKQKQSAARRKTGAQGKIGGDPQGAIEGWQRRAIGGLACHGGPL